MKDSADSLDVIATIGPSLLHEGRLEKTVELGVTILRINSAHLDWNDAEGLIRQVRMRAPAIPILLDISGRKVRLCGMAKPVQFQQGERFEIRADQLNFPQVMGQLSEGGSVSAVDGTIRMTLEQIRPDGIVFRSQTSGILQNGKGLHFHGVRTDGLPVVSPFEEKQVVRLKESIDFFGLSFVRTAADITYFQNVIGDPDPRRIIPKIETREAMANLTAIVALSEAVLIDRGDLAGEIGMTKTVSAVEKVIYVCKEQGKKVFVATHFLRSMIQNPAPTMSEYFDLHYVLSRKIDGLQFSDETAIGHHPEACLRLLQEALAEIRRS